MTKYSKISGKKIKKGMQELNTHSLKSGKKNKAGTGINRNQAVVIGLIKSKKKVQK